jgi:RND family efflux transporter MFP subunit
MPRSSFDWFLATAVLTALASGCSQTALPSGTGQTAIGGATQVDVVEVTSQDIERQIDLPGASAQGYESADLMAKIDGYVKSVHVDIGMEVKQGDVLAVLDVPEMVVDVAEKEALIRQAEADLHSRQADVEQSKAQREADLALKNLRDAEYRRIANLVESGALHQQRFDEARFAVAAAAAAIAKSEADVVVAEAHVRSARAQIEVAQAALAKSETMLQYATISAPFDGVITRRFVDRGAFVRPANSSSGAAPLFSIARVDKLRVVVSVPMTESTRISVGQKAVFGSIGGLPGTAFEEKIARYAVALEPESRMMRAEIDLPNPPDPQTGRRKLQPGMFGTVSLVVESLPGTPTVPTSALGTNGKGQHYVMVVESGKCRRRPVEVVFNDAVTAGLKGIGTGTLVVAKDVTRLEDGQDVAVRL